MGKITVDLETRSDKWSAGISKADRDLKSFVDNAQKGFKALTFQRGASGFADVFAKGTTAAADMATAIRTGASNSEVFGEVINKIPIVGQFKQAGEAIRELVTGEKAAVEEARKLGEMAAQTSKIFREVADSQREQNLDAQNAASLRGVYGDEKARKEADAELSKRQLDAELEGNKKIVAVDEEKAKIREKIEEIEKHKTDLIGAGIGSKNNLTDAQNAELVQLNDRMKALDAQRGEAAHARDQKAEGAKKDHDQKIKDLDRERAERQRQFLNADEEQAISFAEKSEARRLKITGDGLKAREVMIRADSEARQRAEIEKVTPEALKGLSDEEKTERLRSVSKAIRSIQKDEAENVKGIREEDARRREEQALEGEERLTRIKADGNIERLKTQDEATNAEHERTGDATRSHLAEQDRIEEEARRQRFEADKKYRDAKREGLSGADENHAAELQAIQEEKNQKLAGLAHKSQDELIKNTQELGKEQRKAWEESGDMAEKYEAKLGDINEQYAKLHDGALRNRQIRNLDEETLEKFKKLNPSHQEDSSTLYGRSRSYAGFTKESDSADKAQEQLNNLKKMVQTQDTFMRQFVDVWNYFKQLTGPIQQLQI